MSVGLVVNTVQAFGDWEPFPQADAVIAVVSFTAFFAGYLWLRKAISEVADAPDAQLDERLVQVRNAVYRTSYWIVGGIVTVLLAVFIAFQIFGVETIDVWSVVTIWIGLLFAMMALPTAIVAWSEVEV